MAAGGILVGAIVAVARGGVAVGPHPVISGRRVAIGGGSVRAVVVCTVTASLLKATTVGGGSVRAVIVVFRGGIAIGPHSVVAGRDVAIGGGSVRGVVVSVLTVSVLQATRGTIGERPGGAIIDPTPSSVKDMPAGQAHIGAELSGKC